MYKQTDRFRLKLDISSPNFVITLKAGRIVTGWWIKTHFNLTWINPHDGFDKWFEKI